MTANATATPFAGASDVSPSPVEIVMNMALAYLVSKSLHVATELGIADMLRDGPKSIDVLATRTGAHRESLHRLLRTLASHGVFSEGEPGYFSPTAASELLRQDFMRDGVLLCGEVTGDGSWWSAVGDLRHSVMTGEPAFDRHHGMGFFDYLSHHPECGRWFDRGMANFASAENPAIAGAYDFARFERVVDVGGGQGGLLAEILRHHGGVRGTLFDLSEVVRNPVYLSSLGLPARWTADSGDFFQAVPAGADAYVLKRILHDWSDEHCVRILRCCRAAMGRQAKLLVVDAVLPAGNASHPGKVMDILMMVFGKGRERAESEFAALFEQAGLRLSGIISTPSALAILEASPA